MSSILHLPIPQPQAIRILFQLFIDLAPSTLLILTPSHEPGTDNHKIDTDVPMAGRSPAVQFVALRSTVPMADL